MRMGYVLICHVCINHFSISLCLVYAYFVYISVSSSVYLPCMYQSFLNISVSVIQISICMRARIHTAYMHACIQAYMHTCMHAYMYIYVYIYMYVYVYVYMYICVYIYVYICIYMQGPS